MGDRQKESKRGRVRARETESRVKKTVKGEIDRVKSKRDRIRAIDGDRDRA